MKKRRRRYSTKELVYLDKAFTDPNISIHEIAEHLGRTVVSVRQKCADLGIQRPKVNPDKDYRKCNKCKVSQPLANFSPRNYNCKTCNAERAKEKRDRLRMSGREVIDWREDMSRGKNPYYNKYTEDEMEYLEQAYTVEGICIHEIAQTLGRSPEGVRNKAWFTGFKRPRPQVSQGNKYCCKCEKELPLTEFSEKGHYCRPCTSEYMKEYKTERKQAYARKERIKWTQQSKM